MIATHNIKVNGRWVRPGESYEPETVQEQIPVDTEPAAETEEKPEAKAAKPKGTSTRRKVSK